MGIIEVVRATAFTLACDPSKGLSRSKALNLKPDKDLGKPVAELFQAARYAAISVGGCMPADAESRPGRNLI
jgi:hypothetical protein